MLRAFNHSEHRAEAIAWRFETAWLAILAGDVDDLHLHVSEEQAAHTEAE